MPLDAHAIDELASAALARARTLHVAPQSTYRLQLHGGFKFSDAAKIIPYLAGLGITHVYASPYLRAKPGSLHGYDVIDHCRLNPELGGKAGYELFLASLREHGMSHICDMVPNHVGVGTNDNVWWNDVLEDGPASVYANFFDINWRGSPHTDLEGRLLLPLLGGMFGRELEGGKLQLEFRGDSFCLSYYERRFPISPRTYALILRGGLDVTDESVRRELDQIIRDCESLPDRCGGEAVAAERHRRKIDIKQRLGRLAESSPAMRKAIAQAVTQRNGTAGRPESFDALEQLLRRQCFRLAYWRTAPDEINYRRFFDVNDLAALAMERLEVFQATHTFVLQLAAQGKIAGLRIDHPDGLYDPKVYFQRLQTGYVMAVAREMFGESGDWAQVEAEILHRIERVTNESGSQPLYVLGEKILARGESLPKDWAVAGTTGYEFLNMVNGLFVDGSHEKQFDELYQDWTGEQERFDEIAYAKKKLILQISLASELNMLTADLKRIAQADRRGIDFSFNGLLAALREIIACFGVYRTYISDRGASPSDLEYLRRAIEGAIWRNPPTEPGIFEYIGQIVSGGDCSQCTTEQLTARRHFAGKFQQLCSPVMAKGVEDTAFYIYNRLLSLNEVGGNPAEFGVTAAQLHEFFRTRQRDWPGAMSTLSTHDTKRSEDVRARLNVLSEVPEQWQQCLRRWGAMNQVHQSSVDGVAVPDHAEQYVLYQTLLGAWPNDPAETGSFIDRIHAFMLKAGREAKVHSSWNDPNLEREKAMDRFIDALLRSVAGEKFREDFTRFQAFVSRCGMLNSLSQTVLKLAAPGVPDTYQGTELFDFSLVDPDNRRPVDFARRIGLMEEIEKGGRHRGELITRLLATPQTGAIKLFVHHAVLNCRRKYPGIFAGDYQALQTTGERAGNVFAFARSDGSRMAIVAVCRLVGGLAEMEGPRGWDSITWGDTAVVLPEAGATAALRDNFTGERVELTRNGGGAAVAVGGVFSRLPVCLLISE